MFTRLVQTVSVLLKLLSIMTKADARHLVREVVYLTKCRLNPLPNWFNQANAHKQYLGGYHASYKDDPAAAEMLSAHAACIDFAMENLPAVILDAFQGTKGGWAMAVIAPGGTLRAYPDLLRQFGLMEWMVQLLLDRCEGYEQLARKFHDADETYFGEYWAKYWDDKDAAEEAAIAQSNTFDMLDANFYANIHAECSELGLI